MIILWSWCTVGHAVSPSLLLLNVSETYTHRFATLAGTRPADPWELFGQTCHLVVAKMERRIKKIRVGVWFYFAMPELFWNNVWTCLFLHVWIRKYHSQKGTSFLLRSSFIQHALCFHCQDTRDTHIRVFAELETFMTYAYGSFKKRKACL